MNNNQFNIISNNYINLNPNNLINNLLSILKKDSCHTIYSKLGYHITLENSNSVKIKYNEINNKIDISNSLYGKIQNIKLLIKDDLEVEVYNYYTKKTINITLLDILEKYYKNSYINIIQIDTSKNNLNDTTLNIIKLIKTYYNLINTESVESIESNFYEAQIIIPYRAQGTQLFRKEQMHQFIKHMSKYMSNIHPFIKYKLIICEQNNKYPFNRGLLLNAGFLEREKDNTKYIKYYIHHNCDLFPDLNYKRTLDYSFISNNEVRDIFGYFEGIGAIAVFNRLTLWLINGFPNNYYGWGAEDGTLYTRCLYNNININREMYNIGIIEQSHQTDNLFNKINIEKHKKDNPKNNGLTTCKYTCIQNKNSEFGDNIIHYLIDFN